jgi:hypothetical protein
MVGITEGFEKSLIILNKHLGWKNLHYTKKMYQEASQKIEIRNKINSTNRR